MATFNKRNWVNGQQPAINDTNLNALESDIQTFGNNILEEANNGVITKLGYDQYSNEETYDIGDYCIYNNTLYVCIVAITTPEDFSTAKWTATSIKELFENTQTTIESLRTTVTSLTTVRTGSGTVNTTIIGSVEANHWERVGKVVTYSFVMTPKTNPGNTATFVTGLPKAVTPVRFVGNNSVGSEGYNLRLRIFADGTLRFDYTTHIPTSSSVIEGTVTYMTNDD